MPRLEIITSNQTAASLGTLAGETADAVQLENRTKDLAYQLQHLSEVSFASLVQIINSLQTTNSTPFTRDARSFMGAWLSTENRRRTTTMPTVHSAAEVGTYFLAQKGNNWHLAYGTPITITSKSGEGSKKSPAMLVAVGQVPLAILSENPTNNALLTNQLVAGSLVTGTQATMLEFHQFIAEHCSGIPRTLQTGTHLNILSGLVSAKSISDQLFLNTLSKTTHPLGKTAVTAQDVIHAHDFSLEHALLQAKIDAQTGSNGGLSTDVTVIKLEALATAPYQLFTLSEQQLKPIQTAIADTNLPIQETAQLVGLTLSLNPEQAQRLNTVFADAAAIPLMTAILEVTH